MASSLSTKRNLSARGDNKPLSPAQAPLAESRKRRTSFWWIAWLWMACRCWRSLCIACKLSSNNWQKRSAASGGMFWASAAGRQDASAPLASANRFKQALAAFLGSTMLWNSSRRTSPELLYWRNNPANSSWLAPAMACGCPLSQRCKSSAPSCPRAPAPCKHLNAVVGSKLRVSHKRHLASSATSSASAEARNSASNASR
mmetsp:Transcript_67850/g.196312  ORF Transcript_67850/g.196312 Transcript_67850/m.196312 type:complete len:201 (+) Transcript_67850:1927-2529(+)